MFSAFLTEDMMCNLVVWYNIDLVMRGSVRRVKIGMEEAR